MERIRKTAALLLLLAVLLSLGGCRLLRRAGGDSARVPRPEACDWDGMDLDPELRRAIEDRTSEILWRIPAEFQPEGAASLRPYTRLDCTALWPELRDCRLIYYFAPDETLRPGWSLTGTGFNFDTGTMAPVEVLIDAVSGKRVLGSRQEEPEPALFGGLPRDTESVSRLRFLAYLLLLLLGDCAGGLPAARLLREPRSFLLVRAGWRRWYWLSLRRCLLSVLAFCGAVLVPGLVFRPAWRTLWAWLLFALHMEMIACVQALLTALFENAAAAMTPVLLIQLASLLLSSRLPGPLGLLLPGNWGALARTAEFALPEGSGGFPLWAAVAGNAAVLLPTLCLGWLPVRRKHLKR